MNKDDKARIQKASRRYPIEVRLPSRPRPYVRGSGPALAPLSIALENDSTAYITAKEVWPATTKDGRPKLHLYYIVRWTDLPAASVLVPARIILDYVSPRTLEDYEYKLSLERDAEEEEYRKKVEEARRVAAEIQEAKRAAAAAELKSLPGTDGDTPSTPTAAPKKKRGRPSKADMLARQSAKGTGSYGSPSKPARVKATGPSLSTPSKSLDWVADELTTDADVAEEEQDEDDGALQQWQGARSVKVEDHTRSPSLGANSSWNIATTSPRSARKPVPASQPKQQIEQPAITRGFTPAALSTGKWLSPSRSRAHGGSLRSSTTPSQKTPAKSSKRKRTEPEELQPPLQEAAWVVERLEDDAILEVKGEMQRCFKVRWEGDWPPDQNPTWEPESNLPRSLVKEYLKKKANAIKADGLKASSAKKARPAPLARKYSSVAEAFAGDVEESFPDPTPDYEDMEVEEKLLVEEQERTVEPVRPPPPKANWPIFIGVRPFTAFNGNSNAYGHHRASPNPHL